MVAYLAAGSSDLRLNDVRGNRITETLKHRRSRNSQLATRNSFPTETPKHRNTAPLKPGCGRRMSLENREQGLTPATFIFGIDAMPNLYDKVEELPEKSWKKLKREPRYDVKTEPRKRPQNVKQQIVKDREFTDIQLVDEYVAEFTYRPTKCNKDFRVVVVWKDLEVHKGENKLFDDSLCFFYITNDWDRFTRRNRL